DVGRKSEGKKEHDEPGDGKSARRNLAGGKSRERHHDDQSNAAGGERKARSGGVVVQQLLHELGLQYRVGVEHAADQHHEEATDREVSKTEKPQVDKRILMSPLPDEEA